VQRIPVTASDVEMQENSHSIRIKHAKELLDIDPKKFVYAGEVSKLFLTVFSFSKILGMQIKENNYPKSVKKSQYYYYLLRLIKQDPLSFFTFYILFPQLILL